MLPIAFGSQTGGSVIRPAAYCGVAGYKPSFRLLPTVGMKCFSWSLDTVGLFGAGVADVAFAAAAITGRDLRDRRTAAGGAGDRARAHASLAGGDAPTCRPRSSARRARPKPPARRCSELALPPIFEEAMRCHGIVQDYEAFRALAFEYDRHRDRLGPMLREQLDKAAAIDAEPMTMPAAPPARARQALRRLMADGEVILTPSAPGAAPHGLGRRPASRPSTGSGRCWARPASTCRGLSDAAGLPLGVQIVARFARDRLALAAARFLEQALGPQADRS